MLRTFAGAARRRYKGTLREIGTRQIASSGSFDSSKSSDSQERDEDGTVVYEGAYTTPLKTVKRISVTSCAATALASVVVVAIECSALRVGMASLISSVGIGTTGLFYWLTKPYIAEIRVRGDDPSARDYVHAKTLTLLGGEQTKTFSLSDIGPLSSLHPFATFESSGENYQVEIQAVDDLHLANALEKISPQGEKEMGE